LHNKIIELSTLTSSYDLLTAGLENVRIKKEKLNQEIASLQNENEKLVDENEKLTQQHKIEKKNIQILSSKLKDVELINCNFKLTRKKKENGQKKQVFKAYEHTMQANNKGLNQGMLFNPNNSIQIQFNQPISFAIGGSPVQNQLAAQCECVW